MGTKKSFFLIIFFLIPIFVFPQEVIKLELNLVEKKLPFGLTKQIPADKPKVSLVLSGGGSRAFAHLGVMRAIEEADIEVDHIVATSMGSVIGGMYSAGYCINDLDSLVRSINWEELFFLTGEDRRNLFVDQKITEDKSLFTIRLDGVSPVIPQSLTTGKKVSNLLTSITLNAPINEFRSFDDLLFKYRAVATELISGERIILEDGPLSEAMRASSSVSFLLPPIRRDSLLLVDGGLVDNLPIKSAMELNPDFIIASDATSALMNESELYYPWNIADQIVSIPSRKVWQENLHNADVLITHNLHKRKNNDFQKLGDLIQLGYENSVRNLTLFKKKLDDHFLNTLTTDQKIFEKLKFDKVLNEVEQKFFSVYNNLDSISTSQIYYDLYAEYSSGNYKNLYAAITNDTIPHLTIHFELNPLVQDVVFKNPDMIDPDSIKYAYSYFEPLIDKPYNADSLLNSILTMTRHNRSTGNMIENVDSVEFNPDNGILIITLNKGLISEIDIEGNTNTVESVIKREFNSIPGKQLKKDVFDESMMNLSATELFNNLYATFEKDTLSLTKLKLNVEETLPNVLRFGLRIDNENYTQAALDIRNENLFGSGSEIGLSAAGGSRNLSLIFEHKTNRIFDTYLTYKAQFYYLHNDVNIYADDNVEEERKFSRSRIAEYRQKFYGGFVGLGAHLKKIGTITTEAKYEINEIDQLYSFPDSNEYKLNISSLKLRLQIDTQNKYPYPTNGIYINTYYETAQKIFGGDVSFAKFSFNYSGYFTVAEKHTFIPKIVFGFADETLPLSQQFNFGGQNNFFGYRDYEFRGRQILITSIHYRYKIPLDLYFDSYVKIGYDLGSSWINQEQIQFDNLKHGFGISLSFDTPIGPADFSIGRSLYLKDTSPDRIISRGPLMYYFTIGYYY